MVNWDKPIKFCGYSEEDYDVKYITLTPDGQRIVAYKHEDKPFYNVMAFHENGNSALSPDTKYPYSIVNAPERRELFFILYGGYTSRQSQVFPVCFSAGSFSSLAAAKDACASIYNDREKRYVKVTLVDGVIESAGLVKEDGTP